MSKRSWVSLPVLFTLLIAAAAPPTERSSESPRQNTDGPTIQRADDTESFSGNITWMEMRNVNFRFTDAVALHVRHLEGEMVPLLAGKPIIFDNPKSFLIRIGSAEVGMSPASLSHLLNNHIFAYPGAPLSGLEVTLLDSTIELSGTMHKAVPAPFKMRASLQATADGNIRIRPIEIQVLGVPAAGLMDVFNIYLGELISVEEAEGIRIEKNDLIMDPEKILPPPAIEGSVTAVRIEEREIVQVFGSPEGVQDRPDSIYAPPRPNASNYMFYAGDTLSFGKLRMVDADLQIVDGDPSDPFDFYLNYYQAQLVAGYTRIMPDSGLLVYMPDFNAIGKTVEEGEKIGIARRVVTSE